MTSALTCNAQIPAIYSFFWVQNPFQIENLSKVCQNDENCINHIMYRYAIILYPSLLTPGIYWDLKQKGSKPCIELLLAVNKKKHTILTLNDVTTHLKVCKGIPNNRPYNTLVGIDHNCVEISKVIDYDLRKALTLMERVKCTLARQSGLEDMELYIIKLSPDFLKEAEKTPNAELPFSLAYEDSRIQNIFKNLNGDKFKMNPKNRFDPFNGLKETSIDEHIFSHHPIFVYEKLENYKMAHLTDIHINSRHDILRRSTARVIHIEESLQCKIMDEASPTLGDMMNICSENFIDILRKAGKSADFVLLGGDYIDHHDNTYSQAGSKQLSAYDVWELVDMSKHKYDKNYSANRGIDMIHLYGIVLSFIRAFQKPILGIAGNHDAYKKAFGISPRIGGQYANEGIPADHNLTFYESILIFGESFHEAFMSDQVSLSKEYFDWFFAIFSPYTGYSLSLPHHAVVCIGWGHDEDKISNDFDPPSEEPSFDPDRELDSAQGKKGHLPRNFCSNPDPELELVKLAINECGKTSRKIILLSHHTYVSFKEDIPFRDYPILADKIKINKSHAYTQYTMGTFEKEQRRTKINNILKHKALFSCILTGHSHRRALYFLSEDGDYLVVRATGIPGGSRVDIKQLKREASLGVACVVSDSAGPIPRSNTGIGPFREWGSDRPSGTLLEFDNEGHLSAVHALRATSKRSLPRAAVAVDYFHNYIYREKIGGIFSKSEMWFHADGKASVTLDLGLNLPNIFISHLSMHLYNINKHEWIEVAFKCTQEEFTGKSDIELLNREYIHCLAEGSLLSDDAVTLLKSERHVGAFLSIKLDCHDKSVNDQYDFKSHWNIEIVLCKRHRDPRHIRIEKPEISASKYREGPLFANRRNIQGYSPSAKPSMPPPPTASPAQNAPAEPIACSLESSRRDGPYSAVPLRNSSR